MPARGHHKKPKDAPTISATAPEAAESSSSSRQWQTIRPWRPPESLAEASNDSVTACDSSKLQVEVVDVSSTAVALAFVEQDPSAAAAASGLELPAAAAQPSQARQSTSSLIVKLNSLPWPHVLHSDPSFIQDAAEAAGDTGSVLANELQQGLTTLVIYGLDPGTSYQVELDWVSQAQADETATPEEEPSPSPAHSATRPIVISTQASSGSSTPTTQDALFGGPPPPYSSHDPSTPSTPQPSAALLQLRNSEADLKSTLAALKDRIKLTESNLNAPLASLKRSFEKSAKEDLRARQRISTLEEATRKLRLLAAEEAELGDALIAEEVEPLSVEAADLSARLEDRRAVVHRVEVDAKKAFRADEVAVEAMVNELEETTHTVEGLDAERHRFQDEVVPDLTDRLRGLEDELKRLESDQARQQQFAAAAAASTWYNFQANNSSNNLAHFQSAPVAVYAPALQAGQASSSSGSARWTPAVQQRAAFRSASTSSVPEWPLSSQQSASSSSSRLYRESSDPPAPPSTLPRFSSAPAVPAVPDVLSAPLSSTPEDDFNMTLPAAAPASGGSRFLSGFRKRSSSAIGSSLPAQQLSTSPPKDLPAPIKEEGNKLMGGLGSKLTRPGSSDSSSSASKMSWSRVVGKGRQPQSAS